MKRTILIFLFLIIRGGVGDPGPKPKVEWSINNGYWDQKNNDNWRENYNFRDIIMNRAKNNYLNNYNGDNFYNGRNNYNGENYYNDGNNNNGRNGNNGNNYNGYQNDNFNNTDIVSGKGNELKDEFNLMSARRPLDFGNPDVFARRERPCRNYDLFCIRNYFAKHGKCKIRTGPAPDPAYRAQSGLYFPRANMSGVLNDISIFGVNGRITEFFVDKVTDKLVISIDFPNLSIIAKYMNLRFLRPRQEPVATEGLGAIRYSSVTITAIIPKLDGLQLDRMEYFVFVNDATPIFYMSPSLIPQDPGALSQLVFFVQDVNASLREAFLTDGSFYPATFIQYNLCDFGLKVL